MKHIHETWAFLVKSGILLSSVYNSELSIFAPNVGYNELLERGDVAQLTSVPFVEVLSIFLRLCYRRSRDQFSDQVTKFAMRENLK